jgi:hypothetical protein
MAKNGGGGLLLGPEYEASTIMQLVSHSTNNEADAFISFEINEFNLTDICMQQHEQYPYQRHSLMATNAHFRAHQVKNVLHLEEYNEINNYRLE